MGEDADWWCRCAGNVLVLDHKSMGRSHHIANIAHGQAMSFADIERVMNLAYEREDGQKLVVCLCLIDSGYDSDGTYDFCANNSDWALPVKGSNNPMMSHFKMSKINKPTSAAHGMNLVLVDGDKYKDMIAARMKNQTVEAHGWYMRDAILNTQNR